MVETEVEGYPPSLDLAGTLVSARGIELKGPWGHVFGPLDLDIDAGGVTVVAAPAGAARTALLMVLCGRMRLTGGSMTVLGHDAKSMKVPVEV